jgi:hypothetical protein
MDFVIDGNAYINVAISVTKSICYRDKSIGAKYYVNDIFNEGKSMLKEQVKIEFKNFCLNYLTSLIAPVASKIDRVHLVFDSKSWRKEYIRNFFQEEGFKTKDGPEAFEYKGNRKKDDNIHLFFDYFQDEISKHLVERVGINHYRFWEAEGDDIIAYLCNIINGDIIVYTVDGDLRQLTYSGKNNVIVIYPKQMSKHKKLCVPEEFNPSMAVDESDNFFSLNESHVIKPSIDKAVSILKNKDYVEYKIDPVLEVFSKIFRGDKKDNIPKMSKMTPTKTNKMIGLIKEHYGNYSINLLDSMDQSFIDFVVENLSKLNKINSIEDLKDCRKHFMFNSKIIRLSPSLFPPRVLDSLKDIKTSKFKKFEMKQLNNLKNNSATI